LGALRGVGAAPTCPLACATRPGNSVFGDSNTPGQIARLVPAGRDRPENDEKRGGGGSCPDTRNKWPASPGSRRTRLPAQRAGSARCLGMNRHAGGPWAPQTPLSRPRPVLKSARSLLCVDVLEEELPELLSAGGASREGRRLAGGRQRQHPERAGSDKVGRLDSPAGRSSRRNGHPAQGRRNRRPPRRERHEESRSHHQALQAR